MTEKLSKLDAKRLVEDLLRHKKELDEQWDKFDDLCGLTADSKLGNAIWRQFDFLVRCVSDILGDETETVAWFIWDNYCGAKGFEHTHPSGKMKKVKNASDLVSVLGY